MTLIPPPGLLLAPFAGLHPQADLEASRLGARLAPPYDVLGNADVRALLASDARNIVALTLPAGPVPERYAGAATTLAAWRADGTLVSDPMPGLYVYEERTAAGHVQRGLLGGVGLADADDGIVLPHENTMAGPVADRLALTEATEANLEPVFLLYEGAGGAAARLVSDPPGDPLMTAQTADATVHRVWRVTDPDVLAAVAADLLPRTALIADGHHRYATALQYRRQQHEAGRGAGPWDFALAFLVEVTGYGPKVDPIHRVLLGLPAAEAARLAGTGMRVTALGTPMTGPDGLRQLDGTEGPAFLLVDPDGSAWLLDRPDPGRLTRVLPTDRSQAWRDLHVTVAHRYLISDLLSLPDTEDRVGFAHDVEGALVAARASGGSALLLAAPPVAAVAQVAGAGERMPRKSTLFTPKPASGLLLRDLRL